jgi:C4-dicarboxylate transporter, DctQ subunit
MQMVLKKIDLIVRSFENIVLGVGLIFMSAIIFINVICRYFFGFTLVWAEELARYIIVWVTFIGIAACARYDDHVKVEVLVQKFPNSIRKGISILLKLVTIAAAFFLMWVAWKMTNKMFLSGNRSVTVGLPIWWLYLSVSLGFTMLSYHFLKQVKNLKVK